MPMETISLLGVWSDSAPINAEKSMTELNGPHFAEIERPNFNTVFRNSSTLRLS
jgi:hypothetical protein